MKSAADLLAEFAGKPGNEELAPLVREVEFLERMSGQFTMLLVKMNDEIKRTLKEAKDDMFRSQTPERNAQVKAEADRIMETLTGGRPNLKNLAHKIDSAQTPEEQNAAVDEALRALFPESGV